MDKVQELKDVVCNARYFCSDFPPSKKQSQSRCHNCGKIMKFYVPCISGAAELPVICKPCYDVLKYAFGVVPPIDYNDDDTRPSSPMPAKKPFVDMDILANMDSIDFAISRPRNIVKHSLVESGEDSVKEDNEEM